MEPVRLALFRLRERFSRLRTENSRSCTRTQFVAILQLYMVKYGDAKEQSKGQPKKRRKTSAFLIFSNETREEAKKKLPASAGTAEIAKELGARWKGMDAKEKDKWKAKAEAVDTSLGEEAATPLAEEEAEEEDDE